MKIPPLPPIPKELVEALDRTYPAKPPGLTDTDRLIWFNAGQRALVEHLLHLYREQQKAALT